MPIRNARVHDLPAAAALLASSLRFEPADAIPAWLMRTTDECGGLTLVAVELDRVVGVSYALPARRQREPVLFSCGLAVAPSHRGQGLGLRLKLEQRRQAEARDYASIEWTTDPLNGRALRVYLSGLGALVTGYRAGLHDGLRADPGHSQDDLEIRWPLGARPVLDAEDVRRVELPWSPDDTRREGIRGAMTELLSSGYVGSGVELDRRRRRCWVTFARAVA